MPEIKSYYQRTTPTLQFQEPQPHFKAVDTGVGLFAQGVAAAQDAFDKREEEQGRAWASNALSNARLQWTVELKKRQESADPNAPDFTAGFINDFDAYAKETIDSAPSPSAKRFLQERLNEVRVSFGEQAATFEASARVTYRDDQFNAAIDASQKLMAVDPSQFEVTLAEQLAIIDASALPPNAKSRMREKAINNIASASVTSRIQKNPTEFLATIGFGNGGNAKEVRNADGTTSTERPSNVFGPTGDKAFDVLPFDIRAKLVGEAISLKNSMEVAAEKSAEKANKELRNSVMKEAYAMAYPENGGPSKLTRSWIESQRPILDDKEYESLVKLSRGDDGDSRSDPVVFRTVQAMLYDDPEGARAYAMREHKNGRLSNSDLKDAMTRSESLGRQQGPKSQYERTRQRISALDPGPFVKDPLGRRRAAEAIYEFDEWVNTSKPSDADIQKRGEEILERYSLWNQKSQLPPPIDPKKSPTNPHEAALTDIGKRWNAAKADYKAKRISKAEYDQKADALNREMRELSFNAPENRNGK